MKPVSRRQQLGVSIGDFNASFSQCVSLIERVTVTLLLLQTQYLTVLTSVYLQIILIVKSETILGLKLYPISEGKGLVKFI